MADWAHFPLFLRLQDETVLLVGGGEIALRKARLLRKAGARLCVVAREVHPDLLADPQVDWLAKTFDSAQLEGVRLAVAATDDGVLNAEVAAAAERRGIWVNVVDDPGLSRVITPSIIDRAPILIAIGSSGTAPVLARRLREQIESWVPAGLGRLASFMGARREAIKTTLAP